MAAILTTYEKIESRQAGSELATAEVDWNADFRDTFTTMGIDV